MASTRKAIQRQLSAAARKLNQHANPPRTYVPSRSSLHQFQLSEEKANKIADAAIASVIDEDIDKLDQEEKIENTKPKTPLEPIDLIRDGLKKMPRVMEFNEPSKVNYTPSLLRLPMELIKEIYICSSSSSKDFVVAATICHRLNDLFQPALRIKPFQEFMLKVIRADYQSVKSILDVANPSLLKHLLVNKAKVVDYCGRTIQGTALQIALGADDISRVDHPDEGMAELLAGYFSKAFSKNELMGQQEIEKQYVEQFPPNYKVIEEEQKKKDKEVLREVINAIDKAKVQFIHRPYDENGSNYTKIKIDDTECKSALEKFRDYLKPKAIISVGKHFNIELLIDAFCFYKEKYMTNGNDPLSPKNVLIWRSIIGYLQRFLPACYAQVFCQSLLDVVEKNHKLKRSLECEGYRDLIFPLTDDYSSDMFCLGNYAIGCDNRPYWVANPIIAEWCIELLKKFALSRKFSFIKNGNIVTVANSVTLNNTPSYP